jgi:hypothetical protein
MKVIGVGKDFLNRTPAAQQLRERMDIGLHKIKKSAQQKKWSLN